MGTLGHYLKNAREARDIDLRDAAQQTRIGVNYLKALEEEDFGKLPGEVFVRGFLKSYARFLNLDQAEVLQQYTALKPQAPSAAAAQPASSPTAAVNPETLNTSPSGPARRDTPLEPFVWGAVICIGLLAFLFSSLPLKHAKTDQQDQEQQVAVISGLPQDPALLDAEKPEKLYLELIALKDTWILIRTDTSPQKKAVLKKGESLIWSAEDRFLLSYGRVSDVKLLLNGEEVAVTASNETPIRDLAITRSGIINQPVAVKPPQPIVRKPKPAVVSAQTGSTAATQRTTPSAAAQKPAPDPAPAAVPAQASAATEPSPSVSQPTSTH